jgi:hypothetical protein
MNLQGGDGTGRRPTPSGRIQSQGSRAGRYPIETGTRGSHEDRGQCPLFSLVRVLGMDGVDAVHRHQIASSPRPKDLLAHEALRARFFPSTDPESLTPLVC